MSSLTTEQRREVVDIITQNNELLMSKFKDSMHEVLDPLKEVFNRALAKNDVLSTQIEELKKKVETLFVMHNSNTEKKQNEIISMVEVKKDIAKIQSDLCSIEEKIRDNKIDDKSLKHKLDQLEATVNSAEASYKTLSRITAFIAGIMGIAIAVVGLLK